MAKNLHPNRLLLSDKDDAPSSIRQEIVGTCREPGLIEGCCRFWTGLKNRRQRGVVARSRKVTGELSSEFANQRRLAAIAMVRQPAGAGVMIFNDVESIHCRVLLVRAAAPEETVREADPLVALIEELAVQR